MPLTFRNTLLPLPASLVIILTGTTLSNVNSSNAGNIIGLFTVASGVQTTPIVLGGPSAADFITDNGGICPCHLIAAVNLPSGNYSITWTAT
jgi:hypothetical protein